MLHWNKSELIEKQNIKGDFWQRGFFYSRIGEKEFYKRDFEELRYRDLSLFTLGSIESKNILDVGCGDGLYVLAFLQLGANKVSAQDILPEEIEKCKEKCKQAGFSNFDLKVGNCEQLLFDNSLFDIVFSGDVFEHITKQQKINFINEIYRVLKPGGVFTIKTPNKDYLKMSLFFKKIMYTLKLKNPFNLYIAHTNNNPNNEHHGLSTYKEFEEIFNNTMFHEPKITYQILNKKGFPIFLSKLFKKNKYFNQQIIITVRKPYFYGLYA